MQRKEILPGVMLTQLPAPAFKRCRVSLNFILPGDRTTTTAYALLPMVMRSVSISSPTPAPKPEKKDPPDDVVRARLVTMRAELEKAAEAGDARAQLRLGLFLYSGSAGMQKNRSAARSWWEKAAAQGNKAAEYYLENCDFTQPPPSENEEP